MNAYTFHVEVKIVVLPLRPPTEQEARLLQAMTPKLDHLARQAADELQRILGVVVTAGADQPDVGRPTDEESKPSPLTAKRDTE